MDRVSIKEPERQDRITWSPNEIKQALEKFKDSSIEYHVYLACYLGLREGEICALTFNDLDKENKTLNINKTLQIIDGKIIIGDTKTKKSKRLIPLQDNVFKFLITQQKQIKQNQLYFGENFDKSYLNFFSVFEDGKIKTDNYVCKKFNKEVKRLGLKKITFHDLRHSCASWLLSEGVDLKIIQEILGHSNFSITADTYAHVDVDQKRKALNKLI